MTLDVNQWEIDGVLLGPGTEYVVTGYRGFGMAPVRTFDRVNPGQDGGYGGRDLFDIRRLELTLGVLGATADDLAEVMVPHESDADFQWLRFRMKGMVDTRRAKVRPTDFDPHWIDGIEDWEARCEWRSLDPVFYSDEEQVLNVALEASEGGLEFPLVYPRTYGSGGSGLVQAPNDGKADTYLVATITGPCGGPRLEHVDAGVQLNMAGLTLGAGEVVVVDFKARTVLLGGTADRYNTLTSASRFFPLTPGANLIRFAAQTGSGATAQLSYRHAWTIGGS